MTTRVPRRLRYFGVPKSTETVRNDPNSNLSGTGQLIRLALRRDRLVLPLWIVVVVLLTTAGAGAYEQLYPDPAERPR